MWHTNEHDSWNNCVFEVQKWYGVPLFWYSHKLDVDQESKITYHPYVRNSFSKNTFLQNVVEELSQLYVEDSIDFWNHVLYFPSISDSFNLFPLVSSSTQKQQNTKKSFCVISSFVPVIVMNKSGLPFARTFAIAQK